MAVVVVVVVVVVIIIYHLSPIGNDPSDPRRLKRCWQSVAQSGPGCSLVGSQAPAENHEATRGLGILESTDAFRIFHYIFLTLPVSFPSCFSTPSKEPKNHSPFWVNPKIEETPASSFSMTTACVSNRISWYFLPSTWPQHAEALLRHFGGAQVKSLQFHSAVAQRRCGSADACDKCWGHMEVSVSS